MTLKTRSWWTRIFKAFVTEKHFTKMTAKYLRNMRVYKRAFPRTESDLGTNWKTRPRTALGRAWVHVV